MEKYLNILKQYWGYDNFRPLQGDIISSIGEGKDTLGLMPTGGGKSITFQVPAMAMDGLCLVITPLIALMKDQVENLRKKHIKAEAIYTGMNRSEIIGILDNCILGDYKFLYISPERLFSEIFITKIKQMHVCLIAVDESHCISQWGYDFRPSYLKIAAIREYHPNAPVIALTATATKDVVVDIQEKLHFSNPNCLKKSFERANLYYVVRHANDKLSYMLTVLRKQPGSAIVYVRSRKKTKEISDFLNKEHIAACYYHAGLSNETKDKRFALWKDGSCRVMVATNAFGMGIDKADVRIVIHIDLPDTLEAYFQEAGRAGRDEKKSFAVLLFNKTDEVKLKKRISDAFPEKDFIKRVYDALGNYYELGVGFGLEKTFDFNFHFFCQQIKLPLIQTFNALKILTQAGYIEFTEETEIQSRVVFNVIREDLYRLQENKGLNDLIHVLLRSYTGLFSDPVIIDEHVLASRLGISHNEVYEQLMLLNKTGIANYIPRKKTPQIFYAHERVENKHLHISNDVYEKRKKLFSDKIKKVIEYATQDVCRSRMLLAYFGEDMSENCGHCDVCLSKKENVSTADYIRIKEKIVSLLREKHYTLSDLIKHIPEKENKLLTVIRLMSDNTEIFLNKNLEFELS